VAGDLIFIIPILTGKCFRNVLGSNTSDEGSAYFQTD